MEYIHCFFGKIYSQLCRVMPYTRCLYHLNNWWLKFFRRDVAFKISLCRVHDIHARGTMTRVSVEAEVPVTVSR